MNGRMPAVTLQSTKCCLIFTSYFDLIYWCIVRSVISRTASPVAAFEVFKLIHPLPDKSTILDYVPYSIRKSCSSVLQKLLLIWLTYPFLRVFFSARFKRASITPLLKKPNLALDLPSNYRLLSTLIYVHFQNTWKVVSFQNYRPPFFYILFKPTSVCLLPASFRRDFTNSSVWFDLSLLLSLDLSATFDTSDHSVLVYRLQISLGNSGSILACLSSHLRNRSFTVNLNSFSSDRPTILYHLWSSSWYCPWSHPRLNRFVTYFTNRTLSPAIICQQLYADDTQFFLFLPPVTQHGSLMRLQSFVENHKIVQRHPHHPSLRRTYHYQLLPVCVYQSSKNGRNAASDSFRRILMVRRLQGPTNWWATCR